jgi:cyclophilin family peptidyl-prolyl cis-trans isomerase
MRSLLVAAIVLLTAAPARAERPRVADERILLRTSRGDLVLALYPDVAPKHVEQLLSLVRKGVYDSTPFFRVDPSFVVQLSNVQNRRLPLTPEQQKAVRKLPAELSKLEHRSGVLSMARADGDPDSAETSFSFLLARAAHLDGKYTIFGELEWGSAVLAALAVTPRDARNQPLEELLVEKALVKTEAEILRMRAEGELQLRVPHLGVGSLPQVAAIRIDYVRAAGLALMMLLSLFGFLLAGRIQPHRASAFCLLTILTGAFFLIREAFPGARSNSLLATAVFFGMVGLFKLMNRFEGARPPAPPPAPAADPRPRPV